MSTVCKEITERLFELQDLEYRDFQAKLMPNIAKERIIGVRQPNVKKIAAEFSKREDIGIFLGALPHGYYEENNVHGCIISKYPTDINNKISLVNSFLPFVDNWATCDLTSLKVSKKDKPTLRKAAEKWILSDKIYTSRFGIKVFMDSFLDGDFDIADLDLILAVENRDYYVDTAVAWYFATALAKRWDDVFPFIAAKKLEKFRHNTTIRKAVESRRIGAEKKELLKIYRIK